MDAILKPYFWSFNKSVFFDAIKFGKLLENIKFKPLTYNNDFNDILITKNTWVSYSLEYIKELKIHALSSHP